MLASACGFDPREGITTYCAGSRAPRYHSDRPIAGLGDLRPGDHLCVIYRNDDEHRIVLSDYLRRGLEAGERVLYIVDARTARQIRGHLRDAGISVRDAERRGQLLFLSRDNAYMREGVFAPQGMISLLRQETQNALDDGFCGLRVTAEMTWALRGLPGSQRLIEYETLLNEFFPGSPCVGLCSYDARRFPPDILLDVLRSHPIVGVGTRICANVYHIPPEEQEAGKGDQATLNRWLLILEENQRLTAGLRERTHALEKRVKELGCLRQVHELSSRGDLSVAELLQAVLAPIRLGWRWPERIGVRIEHEGSVYSTEGFELGRWRIAAPIRQHGAEVGTLEVAYPDPPPEPEPFLPEELSLLHDLSVLLGQALASRHDMERIDHLQRVLRAIRNVKQLIAREHDLGALIQRTCELLVEERGVMYAWVATVDHDGRPVSWGGSSTPDEIETLIAGWKETGPPLCVQRALASDGVATVDGVAVTCPKCPMANSYGPDVSLAARLSHAGRVYGVLVAGIPSAFRADPEALDLFEEIAGDLGYALSAIQLEAERRESKRQLTQLLANLPGMAYRCRNDRQWTMLFASGGAGDLLGYTPEALVDNRDVAYADLIHPEDRQYVWDTIQNAIAHDKPFTLTYRIRTATGEEKWAWETGIAVADKDGEVVLEGFITDVTERVRAREALQAEREGFLSLLDSIDHAIYVADPVTYEILFANRHLRELLGGDPVGKLCYKEFQGRDSPCEFCTNPIILRDRGRPWTWEHHNPRLGRDYFMTDRIIPWHDGRDVRFELAVNVTELKEAERRQAELVRRLTILHRVGQEITHATVDPEQLYATIHKAVAELMPAEAFVISLRVGENEAEAVYLVDEGGHHPPDRIPRNEGLTWEVLETERPVFIPDATRGVPFKARRFGSNKNVGSIIAVPLRTRDHTVGMLSTQSYRPGAFTEEDVQILEMLGSLAAEALDNARLVSALQASEARFRRLADNAPDLIYRVRLHPELTVEYMSLAAAQITGYSPEEFYANPRLIVELVHPEDRSRVDGLSRGQATFGRPVQLRWVRKDGRTIWGEQITIPVRDENGDVVAIEGIARDITDRKKAVEEIQRAEEKYRALVGNLPAIVYTAELGEVSRTTYISPQVRTLLGYTPEEWLADPGLWADRVHPEDRERVLAEVRQRDAAGEPLDLEYRVVARDGTVRWFRNVTSIADGGDGAHRTVHGVMHDITGRRLAEEELRASYAKMRRMFDDMVNVLASTIELRDPYTAGHQRRVAELVVALGSELGLPADELNGLRIAGLVHDVGKVIVPAEILSKPGHLSELEMYLVRAHPEAGFNVLRRIEFPWPVAEIVYQHHERLDGSGYPRGLEGDAVLLGARILAVADVVEAMSSHRPYRAALGTEAALAEIEAGKGRLYDPKVVDACVKVFRDGFRFAVTEGHPV